MGTKEKIKNWLQAEYNSLHLEHISEQKESEIQFYCIDTRIVLTDNDEKEVLKNIA